MNDSERAAREQAFKEAADTAWAYVRAFEKLRDAFGIAKAQAAGCTAVAEAIEASAAGEKP